MDNPNYNNLLKAELVILLFEKDEEILSLRNQHNEVVNQIKETEATITELQNQLDNDTKDGKLDPVTEVFGNILQLTDKELQDLTNLSRTTEFGIQAYTGFIHGVLPCNTFPPKPDEEPDEEPNA